MPAAALARVANNTIEMAHSVSFYNLGKDPAWAVGAALPFGLNARQQNACTSGLWLLVPRRQSGPRDGNSGSNTCTDNTCTDNARIDEDIDDLSGAQGNAWVVNGVDHLQHARVDPLADIARQ